MKKIKATILGIAVATVAAVGVGCDSPTPTPEKPATTAPSTSDKEVKHISVDEDIAPNGVPYPKDWGIAGASTNHEGKGSGINVDYSLDDAWLAHTGGEPFILSDVLSDSDYTMGSTLRIIRDSNPDRSRFCSVGGAVLRGGNPYLMTAGHCASLLDGDLSEWKVFTGDGETYIGQFSEHIYDDISGSDYGFIPITMDMYQHATVMKGHESTPLYHGQVSDLEPGMTVCKIGGSTGEQCGPILNLSKFQFSANILNAQGDSGGVVYYEKDGQTRVIGNVSSVTDKDPADASGKRKAGSITYVSLITNYDIDTR